MNFSIQWFGYGAGLVMVGWFAGTVVSVLMSALRGVR
jgi:hypothetical protein